MRPGTRHYVITLQHAITWGRHFIATSTISQTVTGIVHTFALDLGITNALHDNTRTLVRRMMVMWTNAICSPFDNPGSISAICSNYPLLTIHSIFVPNQRCTPMSRTFRLPRVSWTSLLLVPFFRCSTC
jgi:hypothetical protein